MDYINWELNDIVIMLKLALWGGLETDEQDTLLRVSFDKLITLKGRVNKRISQDELKEEQAA